MWEGIRGIGIGIAAFTMGVCTTSSAQDPGDAFPEPKNGNVYVIAHRGVHDEVAENTLSAYRKAIGMGGDFVEIDLRNTRDGRFVSVHNETIDAYVEGKKGKVGDFLLSELQRMPLKSKNPGAGIDYIPTFEEILVLCKGRIGIYLDLKEPDIEKQVQLIRDFGMERQVVWYIPASYEKEIRALQEYCRECPVMSDPGNVGNLSKVLDGIRPKIVASDMGHLTADFVRTAHAKEVKVFVDDDRATEKEWQQIVDWGTDGIQTDRPQALIDFLKKMSH